MKTLVPGSPVIWQEQNWVLADILSLEEVVLKATDSNKTVRVAATEVKQQLVRAAGKPALANISDRDWSRALSIFEAIRPLIGRENRGKTYEEVVAAAKTIGKHPKTVYRWIALWNSGETVSSLIRNGRSDAGKPRTSDAVEEVIQECIPRYLTPERPTVEEIMDDIRVLCRTRGLKAPHIATVQRRISKMPQRQVIAKRIGKKTASERFDQSRGSFPFANTPFAVFQIDHTPIDVIFVDKKYRRPIGRGYLTIVMDVCSRMLGGFCITLDPPSASSAGIALAHAILPKEGWLRRLYDGLDIQTTWPFWGKPAKIFTDNAKEFRGKMLTRACKEHNILLEHRPKGLPRYGGHVERLFRTFMKKSQSLPGTTFSNNQQKIEYNSEGKAVMTIDEYEQWFTVFVTKIYHRRKHGKLNGLCPLTVFEQHILGTDEILGIGLPAPVTDELKFRLDFLPYVERTIQQEGVRIEYVHWNAPCLARWVESKDPDNPNRSRTFIFAYDPRDMGIIYFLDPDTHDYLPIPLADLRRKPFAYWELIGSKRSIAKDPNAEINEDLLIDGIMDMRRISDSSAEKTKSARRFKEKRTRWKANAIKPSEIMPSDTASSTVGLPAAEDEWPTDITPYEIEEAK